MGVEGGEEGAELEGGGTWEGDGVGGGEGEGVGGVVDEEGGLGGHFGVRGGWMVEEDGDEDGEEDGGEFGGLDGNDYGESGCRGDGLGGNNCGGKGRGGNNCGASSCGSVLKMGSEVGQGFQIDEGLLMFFFSVKSSIRASFICILHVSFIIPCNQSIINRE